jgi:hypothetical protein
MRRKAVLTLVLLAGTGCSVQDEYVEADRATFDVVAPAHEKYLKSDSSLSGEERERRLRLLDSWRLRIEKAEGKEQ